MLALSCFAIVSFLSVAQSQDAIPSAPVYDHRGPGIRVNSDTGPLSQFSGGRVSWRFNSDIQSWGSGAGLEYVPTIKDAAAVDQVSEVSKSWGQEVTHVMAFDAATGSDGTVSMPYTESLELWTKLRANLDPKYRLGAPLTLKYTGGALPQAAFQEWYEWVYKQWDMKFDFIPIEYEGDNIEELSSFAWASFAQDVYWPVWITKLTCRKPGGVNCTESEAANFMQQVEGWLADKESADWVERWACDGADPDLAKNGDGNGFLSEDGSLNALGKKYVGV